MKTILSILILLCSFCVIAQDQTPIVVNLSDNAVLQYSGAFVKQKCVVLDYRPIINGTKDFYIKVRVSYYQNNSGAYGGKITDLIQANGVWSQDQKNLAAASYQDWVFEYQSTGKLVDPATGNIVDSSFPGNIPEYQYWQTFTLIQAGVPSASGGAMAAIYTIIGAKVAKLNTRKSW